MYAILDASQVQRALKHAVNAGLLRHRSGRYKTLATLNPNSVSDPSASKEPAINNQKKEEKKSKPNVQPSIGDMESSRRTQQRKYAIMFHDKSVLFRLILNLKDTITFTCLKFINNLLKCIINE